MSQCMATVVTVLTSPYLHPQETPELYVGVPGIRVPHEPAE